MSDSFPELSFQSVADVSSLAIVACSAEGKILYSNPAALTLLGESHSTWPAGEWDQLQAWLKTPTGSLRLALPVGTGSIQLELVAIRLDSESATNFVFFLLDQREHQTTQRELAETRDRLRLLADQLVHAQEAERTHLAREIHDGLLQYVIGAGLYLDKVRSGGEFSLLDTAALRLESAALEGRRLIGELRPPGLDDFGLKETVRELVRRAGSESQISIQLRFELDESDLPDPLEVNLFRMVQEAISNVLRHSGAKNSEVAIWREGESLRVSVTDDGQGFDPGFTRGVGLSSMEERAGLFGGCCWVHRTPGLTSVEISIPWSSVERKPSDEHRRPEDILPSFFSRLRRQVEAELEGSPYPRPMTLAEEELNALAHELQVYQIELEMQNEELRRGRSELEHERDRYRQLFEHAPVGYLELTPDLEVSRVNPTACEILALPSEKLRGRTLESLVCVWSRDKLGQLLQLGSGQKELWMRRHGSKTQVRVRLELQDSFERDGRGRLAVLCSLGERSDQPLGRLQLEQQVGVIREGLGLNPGLQDPAGLDLNSELTQLSGAVRELLPGITLEVLRGNGLPNALVDSGTLRLLVTNLVQNAADAGSDSVTLSTAAFQAGAEGTFVGLDVSDTGAGMSGDFLTGALEAVSAAGDARELRLLEAMPMK